MAFARLGIDEQSLPAVRGNAGSYRDYLAWLSEQDTEKKRLGFERRCRGWVKGSKEFRKAVLENLKDDMYVKVVEAEAQELREPLLERRLKRGLEAIGKSEAELLSAPKGCDWKVALAGYLRESSLAPNRCLAQRLNMGTPKSVSSRVSTHRRAKHSRGSPWNSPEQMDSLEG